MKLRDCVTAGKIILLFLLDYRFLQAYFSSSPFLLLELRTISYSLCYSSWPKTAPINRHMQHNNVEQQTKLSQFSALMNSFDVHQSSITLSPFNDHFRAHFPLRGDETIKCIELQLLCNLKHIFVLINVDAQVLFSEFLSTT